MKINNQIALLFLAISLSACGGGSGGSNTVVNPSSIISVAGTDARVTVSGKTKPDSSVLITFPSGETKTIVADSKGDFNYTSLEPQPSGSISIESTNGSDSATTISQFTADLDSITVLKALYKATGVMPELPFKPSLGVNTEAPQGADPAGMPMPFVDIFRTARPFADSSNENTQYDQNNWPIKFAPNTNVVISRLLQGTLKDSIPDGTYTVLYDQAGADNTIIEFGSGPQSNYSVSLVNGYYKGSFDLELSSFNDEDDESEVSSRNQIYFTLKSNTNGATNSIKNIRFVMPGGTCEGNPFLRVMTQNECPAGKNYQSFADRLETDRNAIIFNPDYLRFLRNFKVIRMMNLMEASLKKLCYSASTNDCPAEVGTWDHRAKLNDAVWGGSDRTDDINKNGVPVEVIVALANTLKQDIWVNIPHPATDNYVTQFANYLNTNLNTDSKVYVEYSNEVWNSGFSGYHYVASRGIALGFDKNLPTYNENLCQNLTQKEQDARRCGKYFAGLRYYSKRSSEIFTIWENIFANDKLVRVLGTSQGDIVRTDEMIKSVGSFNVDAIAMAPYFYGCAERTGLCADKATVSKVLADATTVDDVFDVIDQAYDDSDQTSITGDPSALQGALAKVKKQLTIIPSGIDLIAYEGGQHLTTSILTHFVTIPAIERYELNTVATLSDTARTEILDKLDISSVEITDSNELISSNASTDGITSSREQAVIDKMAEYRTISSAYVISAKDVLVDNQITANEASAMTVDYRRVQVKRAEVVEAQKAPYRKLFKAVNRDPRMKQRYLDLLEGWKSMSADGTTLFTLYTLPQSYYRYGNWGLKEHLNTSREDSPKFDAVMSFQESVGNCWWNESGCTF